MSRTLAALALALNLVACSSSGLSDRTIDVGAPEVAWRTSHGALDVGEDSRRDVEIEVPVGATWLDIQVVVGWGEVAPSVLGPTFEDCAFALAGSMWSCRLQAPAPGTWYLRLDGGTGGAGDIVPSWEIGGAEQAPIVLVQREVGEDPTSVQVTLPDALGTLRAKVAGSGGEASIRRGSVSACTPASTCDAVFPRPGQHTVTGEVDAGTGELTVTWIPAELVLDVVSAGGTQNHAVVVPAGATTLAVSSPDATNVKLTRGTFVLCEGTDRCVVDAPVAGDWNVVVTGETVLKVGVVVADLPPTEDDHGDDASSATVVGVGSLEATLHAGDRDWFDVSGLPAGTTVRTLGQVDTFGTLFDASGAELAHDDESGSGSNFSLTLPEGAAHLEVRGFRATEAGAYTLVVALPEVPEEPEPMLVLSEVLVAAYSDTNCDGVASGTEDEFVEIVNVGDAPVDLDGYTISDSTAIRHVFGPRILGPHEGIVVYGGGTPACDFMSEAASTGGLMLGNSGDAVTLTGPGGTVDSVQITEPLDDQSVTRWPELDPAGAVVDHERISLASFSPGRLAMGGAFADVAAWPPVGQPTLLLNEVLPGQFAEIVNYGTAAVELGGIQVVDGTGAVFHTFDARTLYAGDAVVLTGQAFYDETPAGAVSIPSASGQVPGGLVELRAPTGLVDRMLTLWNTTSVREVELDPSALSVGLWNTSTPGTLGNGRPFVEPLYVEGDIGDACTTSNARPGTVDCNGVCAPTSWLGDGHCGYADDYDLTCP
ncbi:MAG: lamin tail domain-containing protein, partial [Alphaproteobacteria bacterium]|nr:lamin tail domain-containing protein [Alphaproteobacteria bacterium]